MATLEHLQPARVFYYFEEITKIPHGSYNCKKISDYLVNFAKEHDLKYIQDTAHNVIIYKPATTGYENAPVTILQGHTDMVCEKSSDSGHDFEKDPLPIDICGDEIYAKDTTLGGDNGIAVAYMLALLESDTIAHPALEAVFTSDEEVGLLGAAALDTKELTGTYMINLDSEDEGVITVGCAGGMTAKSHLPIHFWEADGMRVEVCIDGLTGGHSGVDVDKNRGNANVLMGRFLAELSEKSDYMIMSIEGGQKDNAIPRACKAVLVAADRDVREIFSYSEEFQDTIRKEYAGSDDQITVTVLPKHSGTYPVMDVSSKLRVLLFLRNVPNGIIKMSSQIQGLVETSTNLGIINTMGHAFVASFGVRSSISSACVDLGNKIRFLTEFLGGEYTENGKYPSWEYKQDSRLRTIMMDVYERMYGKKSVVEVIHAGLECGVFYEKINHLDCVSIGPNMKNVHTTEEVLSISSVQRTWDYLIEVLKEIKG